MFHATLYDCVITNNVAGYCGGGLAGGKENGVSTRNDCRTKAYNCLIGWNRAPYGGGAAVSVLWGYGTGVATSFVQRAYCQLINCTVISNTASVTGGGAHHCLARPSGRTSG